MPSYENPLARYHVTDEELIGDVYYFGYTDREGKWYIQKQDRSSSEVTYRYARGDTNYEGNWKRREQIGYGYFKDVFKNTS